MARTTTIPSSTSYRDSLLLRYVPERLLPHVLDIYLDSAVNPDHGDHTFRGPRPSCAKICAVLSLLGRISRAS